MNTMPKAEAVDLPAPPVWDSDLVEVYRVGYGKLVRLAYLLTGHAGVAEEVVQDAFVATHRIGDLPRDPYTYVRRAVVNRCRSWGRRYVVERAHRPRPPDPAELAADEMWDALAASRPTDSACHRPPLLRGRAGPPHRRDPRLPAGDGPQCDPPWAPVPAPGHRPVIPRPVPTKHTPRRQEIPR